MSADDRRISFHVEGPLAAKHTLPAAVLIRILEGAQRAIELIGFQVEGRVVKARARTPKASQGRFQLVCQIPVHGCYAMPVVVGDDAALFPSEQSEEAARIFKDLLALLQNKDRDAIYEKIPDQGLRARVLESVKGMLPDPGSSWRLDIYDAHNHRLAELTDRSSILIDEMVVPASVREAAKTVTGTLSRVDFNARMLTIINPVTNREMDCYYSEDLEDLLFENRRGLLQVTGRMILDDSGTPEEIIEVTDIKEVDLSEISFGSARVGELVLLADPPLIFTPSLDESQQYFCLAEPAIGVDVFGESRQKLLMELEAQIAMLWREYALAPDGELDAVAMRLKARLRVIFTEVIDAT